MDNHPPSHCWLSGSKICHPCHIFEPRDQHLSKIDHPYHTFGSLGPKLWKGCKFWIEKMKFATPLTFLVLWVSKFGNPLTLLALWNIFCFVLQRNVIEKQSFQSFVATPLTLLVLWVQNLAHFWLSVSKIWHPSHTFGFLDIVCGLLQGGSCLNMEQTSMGVIIVMVFLAEQASFPPPIMLLLSFYIVPIILPPSSDHPPTLLLP